MTFYKKQISLKKFIGSSYRSTPSTYAIKNKRCRIHTETNQLLRMGGIFLRAFKLRGSHKNRLPNIKRMSILKELSRRKMQSKLKD